MAVILHKINDLSKTTMGEFRGEMETLGGKMFEKALTDAPPAHKEKMEAELTDRTPMGLLVLALACVSAIAERGDEGTALLAIMTDLLTDHMEAMVLLQQSAINEFANLPTNGSVN